jgi:hypothetical protein
VLARNRARQLDDARGLTSSPQSDRSVAKAHDLTRHAVGQLDVLELPQERTVGDAVESLGVNVVLREAPSWSSATVFRTCPNAIDMSRAILVRMSKAKGDDLQLTSGGMKRAAGVEMPRARPSRSRGADTASGRPR